MRIKYSALNKIQHDILNSSGWHFGDCNSSDWHNHYCRECSSSWSHSNPQCTEPDDVTSICPRCEEEFRNEQDRLSNLEE